jgi:hypothetical protein
MLDFISNNRPGRAGKPRQHCAVIAGPGPYVKDLLAGLDVECRKTEGVKKWLPIVDPAFRRDSDDNVLVQERGIVGRSLNVIAPGKDFPRPRTDETLSGRGCKGIFQPFVLATPALLVTTSA